MNLVQIDLFDEISIGVQNFTISEHLALFPVTIINLARTPLKFTSSASESIFKLSLVLISIGEHKTTKSIFGIILPSTSVRAIAALIIISALSTLDIILPITSVSVSIRVEVGSFTMFKSIFELSLILVSIGVSYFTISIDLIVVEITFKLRVI